MLSAGVSIRESRIRISRVYHRFARPPVPKFSYLRLRAGIVVKAVVTKIAISDSCIGHVALSFVRRVLLMGGRTQTYANS